MSADNSVARGGLDAQTQAGQAAFQIPPELATRYQVRIIEPSDGSERRVGMFLPTDHENPSIEIAGDRIIARNEDPETVSALVTIAKHNGWAGIDVEGSPEFRQAVWTAASREGLTVRGYEPSFDEQARMEELRRAEPYGTVAVFEDLYGNRWDLIEPSVGKG
ncbi:LPD7 domain-containing protein [Sphingomonas sp. LR55]|uniref:LPD7 domain-containing protein n=1 Tax=Sphingomonas sp. LR55 TaxID=3050231 RepID=UPI002FE23C80